MEFETDRTCKICNADEYKYICPRCGIPYCSVNCYRDPKKHIQCSESFYKECIIQKMQTEQNPEKVKRMKEVLQRFHEEYRAALMEETGMTDMDIEPEALDSDDEQPLGKRMKGVDLDNSAEVWKNLTPEERDDFKRFAREYETRKTLSDDWNFDPAARPKLVQEVGEPAPTPSVLLE